MRLSPKFLMCVAAISLPGCIYYTSPPQSYSTPQPAPAPVVNDYVAPPPQPQPQPQVVEVVQYQPPPPQIAPVYENDLAPYGHWFVHTRYGRCWIPNAMAYGWRPYTVGHWVYTDDSCYWVSEDREVEWGGIVYHYGQWVLAPEYGWIWVPGTTWAPAWVAWREGNGYCGWTPLPPECCQGDVVTVVEIDRYCPADHYVYCDEHHFNEDRVDRHIVHNNVTIINNTTNITNVTIVNNRVVNHGVPADHVEHLTGVSVRRSVVRDATSPDDARRLAHDGTPVHYVTPAIEKVHTRVEQDQAQLRAEREKQAAIDQQLQQTKQADRDKQIQLQKQTAEDRKLDQQKAAEQARQAAEDQKLARQKQIEQGQQAERDKQLQHEKDVQAAKDAAEERARQEAAAKQAAHDAAVQRQQQEAAAKQAEHDRAVQAARDAEAARQAERDKAAANAAAAERAKQQGKAKPKPGQPATPAQPPQ